ncbi:hypothetical protein [Bacillus cereus]|uniref:hypothetical protein n=1 Tax=Bacillus cereus TaxID=1396 RepID=UPI000BF4C822|nr:hypothetical protein [Bacillus cereus]PEQ65547.1 hypothetical protein CN469_11810 [Bacillus cereus]
MKKHKSFKRAHFRGVLSGTPKVVDDGIEFHLKSKAHRVKCRIYDFTIIDEFNVKDYLDVVGIMYLKNKIHSYEKTADGFIFVQQIRDFTKR